MWLDGKNHYLGPYDSPESKTRYRELVEAWQLRDDQTRPFELRIGELILPYLEHACSCYRKNGMLTSEIGWIEWSCRFLMPHRRRRAADLGPLTLKTFRLEMIGARLSRNGINARIARIRRMIRWTVSKQLVRPDVLVALEALSQNSTLIKKGAYYRSRWQYADRMKSDRGTDQSPQWSLNDSRTRQAF